MKAHNNKLETAGGGMGGAQRLLPKENRDNFFPSCVPLLPL